jgi:hypothetical protein
MTNIAHAIYISPGREGWSRWDDLDDMFGEAVGEAEIQWPQLWDRVAAHCQFVAG